MPPKSSRRRLLSGLPGAMLLLSIFPVFATTSTPQNLQPKTLSSPVSQPQTPEPQTLSPGEKHTHTFTLKANDYLKLVVEQLGIDVAVRLIGPDGKVVIEVDSPNGTQGPEPLAVIVEQAGTYTLEIEPLEKTAPPGKIELKLEPIRPATEQDKTELEVKRLNQECETLFTAGKIDQAQSTIQQAVDKAERDLGPDHPALAESLNNLASLYKVRGDYPKAESLVQRALAINEKAWGPNHPAVGVSLNILATFYLERGNFPKAEPLFRRALDIREHAPNPNQQEIAQTLSNLGTLSASKGDFVSAEQLYQRAVELFEKSVGPNHPELAVTIVNLAEIYQRKSDYAKAERLYLRGIAIQEKWFGPNHPNLAFTQISLATLYRNLGNVAKAEPLFQQGLATMEKTLGPNHPTLAQALNNFAVVYRMKGDFSKTEAIYERSLAILEKSFGSNNPSVAFTLNNLGLLYCDKGDYTKAESVFQRSLAIREKVLGPDHIDVAQSLINLGNLYSQLTGDSAKTEECTQRALTILEKMPNPAYLMIGICYNTLAGINQKRGNYAQAEALYNRALSILEKGLGPDSPFVAISLFDLATLYQRKGDLAKAEPLFQRALLIQETATGSDHPNSTRYLNGLSLFYQLKGDLTQAVQYRKQANDGTEHDLMLNLVSGSEHQKALYLKKTQDRTDQTISLHIQAVPQDLEALKAAVTVVLRRKGRGMDAMTSELAILRNQSNPEIQKLLDDYAGLAGQISVLTLRGPDKKQPKEHLAEIQALENQKDALENEISRRSLEFKIQTAPITLAGIQTLIPADTALVEYAIYRPFDVKAGTFGKPRYAAYVVKPGSGFRVQGSGLELLSTGNRLLKPGPSALHQPNPNQSNPVEPGTRNPEPGTLLLKPGPSALNQSQSDQINTVAPGTRNPEPGTLLLKPGPSALHQPNPNQINPVEPGTRNPEPGTLLWTDLGEAEAIDQAVTVFRQVLGNRTKNISTEVKRAAQNLDKLVLKPVRPLIGQTRHLLISPDGALNLIPFAALVDEKGTFLVEKYTLTYLTSGRDLLRMQVKIPYQQPAMVIANPDYAVGQGPILAGRQIKPLVALPSTAKEGQEIQGLLEKAHLVIQTEATEAIVKKTKRPEILHIATHGYFLEDVPKAPSTSEPRILDFQDAGNLPPPRVENPLLRSWLFFAGANRGGDAENDGIMTALEAAQLDLWGTKLVVLSACETGVGETKNGDGIYGLRRALVLAGSESQVMSLWNVSDRATRELMVEYYTRLKNGEGRSEALRNVQLKMLKDPLRQHPYYWAAFIQSGEWANLEEKK